MIPMHACHLLIGAPSVHGIAHYCRHHMRNGGDTNQGALWSPAVPAGWLRRLWLPFPQCKRQCSLSLSSLPVGKETLPPLVTPCVDSPSQLRTGLLRGRTKRHTQAACAHFPVPGGNMEVFTPQLDQQLGSAMLPDP